MRKNSLERSLDKPTRQILHELQRDARQSSQQLADKVGLTTTPVWRRIRELEDSGVIRRYAALVDRERVGLDICVLANVSLERHSEGAVEAFERRVLSCSEIIECYALTGEADYVIKVVVPDMKAYDRFLHEVVFKISGVSSIRTNVVLREIKYETALPV
jgi:Lrp/AsnC family transcriptional regulator, leucine-responsive regulatory protein